MFHAVVQRAAVLSLHTSPLAQPGSGDSGGMNVYVRELVSALSQAGVECTTFTRRTSADQPEVVVVEPGHRVVHVPAGPFDLAKEQLPSVLTEFGDRVIDHLKNESPADVVHANYFLSGLVAHRIKHELDIPFISTFHTLAKVKAEGGDLEPEWRHRAEQEKRPNSVLTHRSKPVSAMPTTVPNFDQSGLALRTALSSCATQLVLKASA